ncbi:MAG: hypothetical protein N5P05_004481 (plasmid) [Chroococcopsis gigantea SAG 12.99]|nr:hypothetical protein [Chroococcopsis gigantea SAG 12.99]
MLLERIRVKRFNQTHSQNQLNKLVDIYSYQEFSDNNYLPNSWQYVRLDKLCKSFEYGSSLKSSKEGKVAVLRMGNLQNGKIDWSDLVYTSNEEEIIKYKLSPLTVLFNRTNSPELVGKTSIYCGERPAIFAGYLIRINNLSELNPEYLNYGLNTQLAKVYCSQVKTDGVNQSNINAQKLSKFEIPFCSSEEQQEVVRRINNLFKLADSIEQHYQQASDQLENLNQSILAKAFRGELVPQDPNDEPASVLLERIKAEKAKAEQPKRTPKKSLKKEIEQLNLFE